MKYSLWQQLCLVACCAANTVNQPPYRVWQRNSDNLQQRQSQSYVDGTLWLNEDVADIIWMFNFTMGTPSQPVSVQIDSGSHWFYVVGSNATQCQPRGNLCAKYSFFNPKDSSSYELVDFGAFQEGFSYGTEKGDLFQDDLEIGGTAVSNVKMGIAYSVTADSTDGSLALFGMAWGDNHQYPTLLQAMKSDSIIQRATISSYFDEAGGLGQLLFGAVDHAKYTGDLISTPMLFHSDDSADFIWATLASVSYNDGVSGHQTTVLTPPDFEHDVILDSGTGGMSLPQDLMTILIQGLGIVDLGQKQYAVPCDYSNSVGNLSFTFGAQGGPTVTIPLKALVGGTAGYSRHGHDTRYCSFEASVVDEGSDPLWGMAFMAWGYILFDYEAREIAMAQAAPSAVNSKDIEAIPATGTNIPGVTLTVSPTGTSQAPAGPTSYVDPPSGTATLHIATSSDAAVAGPSAAHGSLGFWNLVFGLLLYLV